MYKNIKKSVIYSTKTQLKGNKPTFLTKRKKFNYPNTTGRTPMQKRKFGNNDGRKQRKTAASLPIQDGDTTTTTQKGKWDNCRLYKEALAERKQQQPFRKETAGQHFFPKKQLGKSPKTMKKTMKLKDLRE